MAAHSQYPPPDEQLFKLAIEARRRGVSFGAFWRHTVREGLPNILTSHAPAEVDRRLARSWAELGQHGEPLDCVHWPSDSGDRLEWQPAVYEGCEGWRRAYEREEATPQDRAVALLGERFRAMREEAAEGFDAEPAVA